MKGTWYNYAKEDWEYLAEIPTDFSQYIPQLPAAQNMYSLLVEYMDYNPIDAALAVLLACVKSKGTD